MRKVVISGLIILTTLFLSGCLGNKAVITPVASPNNDTSVTNEQQTCDQSLWEHVYNPDRLQIIDKCRAVVGTIEYITKEADGDDHIRLKLDLEYTNLINQKNIDEQRGDLVIESICTNPITQKDAIAPCSGFNQNFNIYIGEHIRVTGAYVLDSEHGWNEIHPVTSITNPGDNSSELAIKNVSVTSTTPISAVTPVSSITPLSTTTPTDSSIPAGATAKCNDGTYSFSQHRQGTCSHHGGVAVWY